MADCIMSLTRGYVGKTVEFLCIESGSGNLLIVTKYPWICYGCGEYGQFILATARRRMSRQGTKGKG
jgi:hypothetical protein